MSQIVLQPLLEHFGDDMAGTECHMDCLQLQKNLIGELMWHLKGYQGRRLSKEIIAKLKPHFARCGLPDRVNADILGPSLTVVNFRTLQNSCTLNTTKRHHHIHSPMWKRTDRNRGYFEIVYNRQRCITLRFTRTLSMAARSGKQRVCNNVLQN